MTTAWGLLWMVSRPFTALLLFSLFFSPAIHPVLGGRDASPVTRHGRQCRQEEETRAEKGLARLVALVGTGDGARRAGVAACLGDA